MAAKHDELEEDEQDGTNSTTTSLIDLGYKDELNLAEFPIAALTDRVPDGQTTLVFEDKLEQKDATPIIRRLTISTLPSTVCPRPSTTK